MNQLCILALTKHNEDSEAKAEFIKVVNSNSCSAQGRIIFSVNFLATDSPCSSPKLYEAKVVQFGNSETIVEFCRLKREKESSITEVKRQARLSIPLVIVNLLQYSFQIVPLMFVGHLGELPLCGDSIASSFAFVTGYNVVFGMSSVLETLCGHTCGGNEYEMLSVHTQRAMLTLLVVSFPLVLLWYYTTRILIACHLNREISVEAGFYIRWMIPSLFAYRALQCLNRFLRAQKKAYPVMTCSGIAAVLNVVICWILVFKCALGSKGAALAVSVSYWVNLLLIALYIKWSRTWTGFSRKALHGILTFLKLGVPSTFMICLEYWSFQIIVLLSGLLPNPTLQTSVLSISLITCCMVYTISVGLGGAISTRIANELSADNKRGALLALRVMIAIALCEGTLVAVLTIILRNVWGRLFTNEPQVLKYLAKMMLLLALSNFLDGFQCVLSGVARGCGWQKGCSFINFGAFYIVGLPCSILFAFGFHAGGMGLFAGITCGLGVEAAALLLLNFSTNWDILVRICRQLKHHIERKSVTALPLCKAAEKAVPTTRYMAPYVS